MCSVSGPTQIPEKTHHPPTILQNRGVLNCTTLPIVVSLDPRALSSNTGTGTSVAVAQRHRLSFAAAAWQRAIVQLGPCDGDVISLCPESRVSSWKLTSEQVTQFHRWQRRGEEGWMEDWREFWCSSTKKNERSIICQGLGNDCTIAALSRSHFCPSSELWCLSYNLNSSRRVFDQVGMTDHTHQPAVVNVSMCPLRRIVLALLRRLNGPIMKLAVKWVIPVFQIRKKRGLLEEGTLNKQILLCFLTPPLVQGQPASELASAITRVRQDKSSQSGPTDSKALRSRQ